MGRRLTFLAICAFVLAPTRAAWGDDETTSTTVDTATTVPATAPPTTAVPVVVPARQPKRHAHKNAEAANLAVSAGVGASSRPPAAASAPTSTSTTSTTFGGLFLPPLWEPSTTTLTRPRSTISPAAVAVGNATPVLHVHWTLIDGLIVGALLTVAVGAFAAVRRLNTFARAVDVPVGEGTT